MLLLHEPRGGPDARRTTHAADRIAMAHHSYASRGSSGVHSSTRVLDHQEAPWPLHSPVERTDRSGHFPRRCIAPGAPPICPLGHQPNHAVRIGERNLLFGPSPNATLAVGAKVHQQQKCPRRSSSEPTGASTCPHTSSHPNSCLLQGDTRLCLLVQNIGGIVGISREKCTKDCGA